MKTEVSQGELIYPLIVNFVLDGLEKKIFDSVQPLNKANWWAKGVNSSAEHLQGLQFNVVFVRYAENFIIAAESKSILLKYV